MKKLLLFFTLLLPVLASAQMHCYQFGMHGFFSPWQDTSFVACTSDTQVIADIQAQLALPVAQRSKHINGDIAGGDDGVNHNGSHNFLWHFIPGQWGLADFSAEVCDGRPYTDVDADTSYWIHTVGFFCPWSSYVQKEIAAAGIGGPGKEDIQLAVFPNPVIKQATIVAGKPLNGTMQLTDPYGRIVYTQTLYLRAGQPFTLNLGNLAAGVYLIRITHDHQLLTGRLAKI